MIKQIMVMTCLWVAAAGGAWAADGAAAGMQHADVPAVNSAGESSRENRTEDGEASRQTVRQDTALPQEETKPDQTAAAAAASSEKGQGREVIPPSAPQVRVEIKSGAGPAQRDSSQPQAQVEIKKAPGPGVGAETGPSQAESVKDGRRIAVNVASRILILYEGNRKIRMYPIGAGTAETPTPPGFYAVETKEVNPTWIDPDDMEKRIPSGPDNPLGYRWIGFSGTYGIHGTNAPESIGGYVSNGCVRMLEKDVEELYSLVSVGTPVVVYYDRIVIDSAPDHTVSYYIYPDGYGWQDLDVVDVRRALGGYGVDNFVSDAEIAEKIEASDGTVTFVAKAYDLIVNGRKLDMRALKRNGVTYLPAVAVATALKLDLHWNGGSLMLTSPYGTAPGIVQNDVVYMNAAHAGRVFRLRGRLTDDWTYVMTSENRTPPSPAAPQATVTISAAPGPVEDKP